MAELLDRKARELFEDTEFYPQILAFDIDDCEKSLTLFCTAKQEIPPVKKVKLKFLNGCFATEDGSLVRSKKDVKRLLLSLKKGALSCRVFQK